MPDSFEACTVELVEGVDIMKLPLAPLEGFVLSRVDRRVAVAEVAALTGLPPDQLHQALLKLVRLGALRVFDASGAVKELAREPGQPPAGKGQGEAPARRRPPSGSGRHRPVGSRRPMMAESGISTSPRPMPSKPPAARGGGSRPKLEGVASKPEAGPQGGSEGKRPEPGPQPSAQPAYDPKLLEEEVDLPLERRKQVLELAHKLESCTHYEALGVDSGASRKEIRAAYFALSKAFHPDTMFRRELGSYKARMELVFKGITEAYDVLSKKRSRADYDEYLKQTRLTQKSERRWRQSVELEGLVLDEVVTAAGVEVTPPPPEPAPAPEAPVIPRRSAPSERGREVARQAVSARISRTFAAVRGSVPPPRRPGDPSSAPPEQGQDRQQRLRSLAESLRRSGVGGAVESHLSQAQAAEDAGDISAAQEHLRRAVSLAPGREDLQAEHTRLSVRLADQLANDYARQAELEEKNGKWSEAALSWSRVVAGRPRDAHAAQRTAAAMLRAGADLRRAHEFARQAVLLDPRDVQSRIVLGQIMIQVGLSKGARRELQAALGLDPGNEMVKNLLAELKG